MKEGLFACPVQRGAAKALAHTSCEPPDGIVGRQLDLIPDFPQERGHQHFQPSGAKVATAAV